MAVERLLPGDGPVAERLAAFRGSVDRDRALHAVERDLAAVRVQAAELRARRSGAAQLEAELVDMHERVASALRSCDIDPSDLAAGLRRYDHAGVAADTRREATLTRTRA